MLDPNERVMDPPSATEPPPESPDPAVTVTEEFCNIVFVIELAGRETEEVAVREPTESAPIEEEARYAWTP